ncbi:MAG: stage V sporulation protein AE [Oscillospiraceae bacterium]|nr:stage V sporulation protein AE [Oscillospiraceae bacterium]
MLTLLINLVKAFAVGGVICTIGELLVLKTKLTPARILVGYVVMGVVLSGLGLYQPLVDFGGAGATVPLSGFGHLLAKGVRQAVAEQGMLGVLTGGLTASAGGIAAAVLCGLVAALIFKPGDKA